MIEFGAFTVAGEPLQCDHCKSRQFIFRPAQDGRNSSGVAAGLAWLAASDVYTCRGCGRLYFFLPSVVFEAPTTRENPAPANEAPEATSPTQCLACGGVIPAHADVCPACGWTCLE